MIDPKIIPIENVPPQNIEAEQSVLGGMLQDKEAAILAIDILTSESFYRASHSSIFSAIMELIENNEPADIVTVADKLHNKGQLEKTGGMSYLSSLAVSVPTVANIEYYARIVQEKSCLRSLLKASTQIAQMIYQPDTELGITLDKAEQLIFNISQKRNIKHFYSTKEVVSESFDLAERLNDKKEFITGLPTGFIDLDLLTTGFQPADMIIVAARPGMGKTSLCLNIAINIATKQDDPVPVAIFSLETSKAQLVLRMLCSEGNISSHKLRAGYLSQSDWPNLIEAAAKIANAEIFIDDTATLSIQEIKARARRLKSKKDIGLIIIDYIQLMQGSGLRRQDNREREISEISRGLKSLARELDIPIIGISQLSRAVESRQDKRPILSDLRESGALEQDADLVLFIYRERYYKKDGDNETEIIVGKQRNGPTGTRKLLFKEEFTKFVPITKEKMNND